MKHAYLLIFSCYIPNERLVCLKCWIVYDLEAFQDLQAAHYPVLYVGLGKLQPVLGLNQASLKPLVLPLGMGVLGLVVLDIQLQRSHGFLQLFDIVLMGV